MFCCYRLCFDLLWFLVCVLAVLIVLICGFSVRGLVGFMWLLCLLFCCVVPKVWSVGFNVFAIEFMSMLWFAVVLLFSL